MQATNQTLKGVGMVVLSMSGIAYIDNFIRLIAEEASLWQFHFVRGGSLCIMLFLIARLSGWRIMPRKPLAVAIRSFFFASSMVIYFGAVGVMTVSQAAAGLFTSPIFVLLVSVLFLGSRIGVWRVVAVVVGFAGVILILRPEEGGFSPYVLLPMFGGLLYALGGIATRRWCEGEATITLLFGNFFGLGLWGGAMLLWFAAFPASGELQAEMPYFMKGWVAPSGTFLFWTGVQAFGALGAVALLTRGYQIGEVSYVAVSEYWFLIAAAFWSYILWSEVPDLREAIGIAAIILAGIVIVVRSK